jgi:outer membrane lipoprotein SlyB
MLKTIGVLFLCLMLMPLSAGCESNKTRIAEGAVIGGLLGGAAGGIIGHQSGRGGAGAGIGIAAGALTGALVGSQIEKHKTNPNYAAASPGANPNQMTLQQIIDLSKQGANEDVIIDKINLTGSKYVLSAQDIDYLKQQGVSQKVVNVMQGL